MSGLSFFASLRAKSRAQRGRKNEEREWALRKFAAPSPAHIKRAVLLRLGIPNAVWVETGTFMGDTAALLALTAKEVHTIEPDGALYEKAAARFKETPHVHVIHGLSENVFPVLLPTLSGSVNFWLDGHFSGGFTHKGPTDCPIRDELASIERSIGRFENLTVLIDDLRCFDPSNIEYADYPPVDFLVDWARKNSLSWHIEHDIFVASKRR